MLTPEVKNKMKRAGRRIIPSARLRLRISQLDSRPRRRAAGDRAVASPYAGPGKYGFTGKLPGVGGP